MIQCPIDDIFVETKMKHRSAKFKNLEPPDALKQCLKRVKPVFFNKYIYLFRAAFCQISKVQI